MNPFVNRKVELILYLFHIHTLSLSLSLSLSLTHSRAHTLAHTHTHTHTRTHAHTHTSTHALTRLSLFFLPCSVGQTINLPNGLLSMALELWRSNARVVVVVTVQFNILTTFSSGPNPIKYHMYFLLELLQWLDIEFETKTSIFLIAELSRKNHLNFIYSIFIFILLYRAV